MARTRATVDTLKDIAMEGIDWQSEKARRTAYSNTISAGYKALDQFVQYANNSGHPDWVAIATELLKVHVEPEKERSRALVQEAWQNQEE